MNCPLVRRTWSPCGQSPTLVQPAHPHRRVSAIAALIISPGRGRVRLCFRLHAGASVDGSRLRAFLAQLRRQIRGPILLLWDGLQAHRAPKVRDFARAKRIHLERLPPYAPELNPVEYAWSWLKTNPLANYAPQDVPQLARAARGHARRLQRCHDLLWSFIEHSPFPLRRK